MEPTSSFSCYLCGGTDFVRRKGVVRDDPSLHVLECSQCRLVTLSSRDHIVPGHYEDSGMHGDMAQTIEAWRRGASSDDERRIQMLAAQIANRRVLDVGCGACGFLLKAQVLASACAGVEPERRVRDVLAGSVPLFASLDDVLGEFDIVTAFHVVEHLPDPRATLRQLGNRLASGGQLVIEVPSADDALLTLYDSDAFQRFTYWSQHLFLFNADTLKRVAEQAGLRVIAIQQFQRYPLSNHLFWLSRGKPGGHQRWPFLDSATSHEAYAAALAAIGKCDTIIGYFERPA